MKMEMDSNWEFGINCHDAEEKNTPESSTQNWVMTTLTNATRDTWWNVIQSPDSCPVVSYHLCAVTDWSRGNDGDDGKERLPLSHLSPRASLTRFARQYFNQFSPGNFAEKSPIKS